MTACLEPSPSRDFKPSRDFFFVTEISNKISPQKNLVVKVVETEKKVKKTKRSVFSENNLEIISYGKD